MNGVQGVEGSNPFIPTRKQKPQGIYGNVDPFSVFGICPFPLSGIPACRSFRQARPYGTDFPRRSPDHGDGIGPGRPGRQQTTPLSTNKNATKVSWRFSYVQKIRDRQTAAMLSATPLSPLSAGTKTSRDGPRVPLRLPSGKGACGNSGLRLHPAF